MVQILKASGRRLSKSLTDLSVKGRVTADKAVSDVSCWRTREQLSIITLLQVTRTVQSANASKKTAGLDSKGLEHIYKLDVILVLTITERKVFDKHREGGSMLVKWWLNI